MSFAFATVQSDVGVDSGSAHATFTSVTNNYYFAVIFVNGGGTISGVTSSNNITFSLITSGATAGSYAYNFFVYGGLCTSGAAGYTVVTGSGFISQAYSLDKCLGQILSREIVQSASTGSTTVTLSALANSSNAVYTGYFDTSSGTIGTPTAYTALASNSSVIFTAFKAPGTTTVTWTDTGGLDHGAFACEVAILPASYGTSPNKNSLMLLGQGK
jgi:hypothetical protein